ncbi:hypothetical protein BDV19DRAFT_397375 [Aspergillus venezuelensis]
MYWQSNPDHKRRDQYLFRWIIDKTHSDKNDQLLAEEYSEDELSLCQPCAAYGVFLCPDADDPDDIAAIHVERARQATQILPDIGQQLFNDLKPLATGGSQFTLKIRQIQEDRPGGDDLVPGGFIHRILVDHAPGIRLGDQHFWSCSREERDAIREAFKIAWIDCVQASVVPAQDKLFWDADASRMKANLAEPTRLWKDTHWIYWHLAEAPYIHFWGQVLGPHPGMSRWTL